MYININGLNINYEVAGEGKDVVLLHGWGASIGSYQPVFNYLKGYFKTYVIDFPGFGKSDPPPEAWGISEYADVVLQFLSSLGIKKPILMGHSFGGRVIINLASSGKADINKLVLIDSAGIKPRRTVKYYIKVYTYKLVKNILLLPGLRRFTGGILESARSKFGSIDYKNASDVMRRTMVKVVNEDLRKLLPLIKNPTLLIWGENDTATPVSDGKLMEKLIPDAGLVVLKNAGHFSYLDRLNEFLLVINSFLKEDMKK